MQRNRKGKSMENYKAPKSVKDISTAIAKRKMKAKVAKAPKSKDEAMVSTKEPKDLKVAETEHSYDDPNAIDAFTKVRSVLQTNLNEYSIAKSKGLRPKQSAKDKIRKSADRYNNLLNNKAVKKHVREEKIQSLDYKLKEIIGD